MSHRATVYTMHVQRAWHPDDVRPLGDIDEQGTSLADALGSILDDGFASTSGDGEREVRVASSKIDGQDLEVVFMHGQRGVVADILDRNDQLRIRQQVDDTSLVRCGSVFRFPPKQHMGFWAAHVNNGRGPKGLVGAELVRRFRENFEDLRLIVQPFVLASVLEEALDNDQLESVKLVKYDASSDFTDAERWVKGADRAKVELKISALERGKQLAGDLARKAVGGDEQAARGIVVFQGLQFDEAKVAVVLDDGTRRTFSIQGFDGGHPFAEYIDPDEKNGEPTDAGVFAELKSVLKDVA